jgi:Ran GTPase-activating protein (RanGAP) involved in mRNA processing and transport
VLSDNRICDAGASALGTVLTRGNASLTSFNIAQNNVSDAGAEVITHALNSNLTLREVFLSVNRIRDRGVAPLFKALATNKTLMHLDLGVFVFFGLFIYLFFCDVCGPCDPEVCLAIYLRCRDCFLCHQVTIK